MNYTIADLIQKLIDIENDTLEIYKKIESIAQNKYEVIRIIARAIEKEEEKYIEYCEKLKSDLKGDLNEIIDFYLYDKVAKLLFEFKSRIQMPTINKVQDLIKYSVELKKNNISLLLDIRGRLVEKMDDVNNNIYKVISSIITEAEKHEKIYAELIIL